MSRSLKPVLIIIPLLGMVVSFVFGWPIWKAQTPVYSDSMGAWFWLLGGFVAFAGGIVLIRHSRWLALAYVFAGFILLFSAGLYFSQNIR